MGRSVRWIPVVMLVGSACGGSNGAPAPPTSATVHDVQSGVVLTGSRVLLDDVVIIAMSSQGDRIWVSDGLTAGVRRGVEVYRGSNPGPLSDALGDHIKVEGTVQEFGQGGGLTVTQIANPIITRLQAGAGVPTPVSGLDPAVITTNAGGEDYEGVLVRLANIKVATAGPYTLTDGTTTFPAEEQIINLTDAVGTCYATVTGIWDYDVVSDVWIIVPVVNGLVTGGTCS